MSRIKVVSETVIEIKGEPDWKARSIAAERVETLLSPVKGKIKQVTIVRDKDHVDD